MATTLFRKYPNTECNECEKPQECFNYKVSENDLLSCSTCTCPPETHFKNQEALTLYKNQVKSFSKNTGEKPAKKSGPKDKHNMLDPNERKKHAMDVRVMEARKKQ